MSVIVPFLGDSAEARATTAALTALRTRPGDELILVDNGADANGSALARSPGGTGLPDVIRVVPAPRMRSSYYARNVGAQAAANAWLLFLDADTRPAQSLLDDYFAAVPPARCGIVAGEVLPASEQNSIAARHARSRGHLTVGADLRRGPHPAGVTANLLVRRKALEELGGFHEVRSGADLEFCWRAAEHGWELVYRPQAQVAHLHAESMREMLAKAKRYGPGQVWVHRRYPAFRAPPDVFHHLWRALVAVPAWFLTGRFERGLLKAIDLIWHLAYAWGYSLGDNRPRLPAGEDDENGAGTAVVAAELAARVAHAGVVSVALHRPAAAPREPGGDLGVVFAEDQPPRERLLSLIWTLGRHPVRTMRLVAERDARGETRLRELAPLARRLQGVGELRVRRTDQRGSAAARRLAILIGANLAEVESD